ncbi:MAG: hypothetical protein ACT443_09395 [Gemmatimonadota bacterium]
MYHIQNVMMHRPLVLFAVSLTTALMAACDRAPTGPELDEVAALLSLSKPSGAANSRIGNSTLPALFRESIARVEAQQGRAGVEAQLSDWRRLQEELKTEAVMSSRAAIQARLEAVHEEELQVVLRVLGGRAITRALGEANVGLAEAQAHIAAAAASGEDMSAAQLVVEQVAAKITAARRAIAISQSREALAAASEAASQLAGLRYFLIDARRIPGLETLFPQAVTRLSAEARQGEAEKALKALEPLKARTSAALRTGDRSAAHELLAQLRSEQIRIVLSVLGKRSAAQLIERVDERAPEVAAKVAALEVKGRDIVRLERMVNESRDMGQRARAALEQGDAATALDLGSHAAGLLNAVQHLTWE